MLQWSQIECARSDILKARVGKFVFLMYKLGTQEYADPFKSSDIVLPRKNVSLSQMLSTIDSLEMGKDIMVIQGM